MKNFYLTILLCLITGFLFEAAAQAYVNHTAAGMNDGSSWPNAYTDLQDALANADPGDTIRVARGAYLPGATPTATFLIEKNLRLLGGYDASTGSRDPEMYETILSGDVNGDDVDDDFVTNRGDNVMTVMTVTANVTNETVVDCIFEDNMANVGGGVLFVAQPPGSTGAGFSIDSCQFNGNNSTLNNSALYLEVVGQDCNFSLTNSSFTENVCTGFWATAAVWIYDPGSATVLIENCLLENNMAPNSGGLDLGSGTDAGPATFTVRNCRMLNNQASIYSGGLTIWGDTGSSPNPNPIMTEVTHLIVHQSFGANSSSMISAAT